MSEDKDSIIIISLPDCTEEQIEKFLEVVGDLFESCGGKGGLKAERVTHLEALKHEHSKPSAHCRHGHLKRLCGPCDVEENEKR